MAAMKLRSVINNNAVNSRAAVRPMPGGTRLITLKFNDQINGKPTIILKNHESLPFPYKKMAAKRHSESGDDDSSYISHSPNSEDFDDQARYPGQSMSKNAVLARENRQKKKNYINSLENTIQTTKQENAQLKKSIETKDSLIASLQNDVMYLKSVLANVGEVSKLLRVLRVNGNLTSTSLKPPAKVSSDATLTRPPPAKKAKLQRVVEPEEAKSSKDGTKDTFWSVVDTLCPENLGAAQEPHWLSNPFPEMYEMDHPSLDLLQDFNDTDLVSLEDSASPADALLEAGLPTLPFDSTLPKAGICLHVCNRRVSLEFCASCSQNAHDTWNTQDKQDGEPH